MIVLGLLFFFGVLGAGLGVVAYTSNNRRRAGMNPIGNVTNEPRQGRSV
ncbi:MAG TPA: hypothetical protein VGN16_00460 [Acidobacteriaceae bacterium]|jgi:hypothetical protein